jgi:hypothetical protein
MSIPIYWKTWNSKNFPWRLPHNHHGTCSAPIHLWRPPPRLGQWRPALARRAPHPWRGQRRSSTADSPGGRSPPLGLFGGFTTSCHHGIKWTYWIYIYIHLWTGISHAYIWYIYICIYHLSAIEKRDNPLNGDLRSRFINHLRFVGWSSKASEQCQVPSVSDNSTRCKTQGRRGVADTADITHTLGPCQNLWWSKNS